MMVQFSLIVQLVMVTEELLRQEIPPPSKSASFPLIVQLVMVAEEPLK
jgi:hypothetical protein